MKICIYSWNGVLNDLALELAKEHKVDLKVGGVNGLSINDYDLFILWNEVGDWGEFVKKVQKKGKKVILMQHGRRGTSRIYPPFNEKLNADIVCVWGEADKKRLMSCGVPEERIRITGTPIFQHLRGRRPHEGKNVVFSPEHWDGEVVENAIVAGQLRKVKGAKITTKCLDGEHNLSQYDNVIVSHRNATDHFEVVAEVLATADVVVGISESTFELLAESLDIPVVIADIWIPKACGNDDRYKDYHREYSEACTRVKDPFKLAQSVEYALKHPEHKREERKKVVLEDGGPDNPLQRMVAVVNEVCRLP